MNPFPTERGSLIRSAAAIVAAVAALTVPAEALSSGYKPVPKHWSARLSTPRGWYRAALCIHHREGAWNANTGNSYFGGAQFLRSTWESVGGPYDPAFDHPGDRRYPFRVTPREQLYRMWLVWKRDGGSFREWGTAGACGLR